MPRRRGVGSITRRRADAALTGIKHMLQLPDDGCFKPGQLAGGAAAG